MLPPRLAQGALGLEIERAFAPAGNLLCVRPEFRTDIEFLQQDVRAEMPEGRFDLILCRNLVFTYFGPALQRRVLGEFEARLAPRGLLVLGRGEELPDIPSPFERLSPELPIWRKRKGPGQLPST